MHRLANFKLIKKKPLQDYQRSTDKTAVNQSGSSLPVLELSLSDAKSFRASVILPDLSRRFTLLRRNGELLPLDNFCEHVRHEFETGQITEEDENILIHQYRQQYLSEAPIHPSVSPTSSSQPSTAPLSPLTPKVTTQAVNLLFSGGSAARDAAYIHKTMRMCNNQKTLDGSRPHGQAAHGLVESLVPVGTLDDISENLTPPTPDNDHTPPQLTPIIGTDQTISENEDWEDNIPLPLTRTQMQRLSSAVDRILGSHQTESPRASNLKPESLSLEDFPHHNPSHSLPNPHDAESRVREELSRALSKDVSPTASVPSASRLLDVQADNDTYLGSPCTMNQPFQHDDRKPETPSDDHWQRAQSPTANPIVEPALNDEFSTLSHHDAVDAETSTGRESSVFRFESFDFNDSPPSVPLLDRNQPLPSVDWTYDDALFIQRTLCSSHSSQSQQYPSPLGELTYDDVLFIQSALCSSHPRQSHNSHRIKAEDKLQRNLSVSTCPSSTVGSPETPSSIISPRSSSLHHRLNLAKSFAKDSSQKTAPSQHPSNNLHSPPETLSGGFCSPFEQILSPSSADGYGACSVPLIPRLDTQSSLVGQRHMASSPIASNNSLNATCDARPRGFNSRAGRPVPTTMLFRDVEAQVVAANAALRLASNAQSDTPVHTKKLYPRKKSISTAQVGAPKLLSASAKLSEVETERSATDRTCLERCTSPTDTSKDLTRRKFFDMRLRKKRPSESRSSHDHNDCTLDMTPKRPDSSKSKLIQVGETGPTTAFTESAYASDMISVSPTQSSKYCQADSSELHSSWKHTHALTSRVRRLMGRQQKLSLNPLPVSKHPPGPTGSLDSNDSSNAVLFDQAPRRLTAEDPAEFGPERAVSSVWPQPDLKTSSHSKSFHELGLSSPDTPSCDSNAEDNPKGDSKIASVISADRPYPDCAESELHHSWVERQSIAISLSSNNPYDGVYQGHLERDDPICNSNSTKEGSSVVDPMRIVVDQFNPQRNESTLSPSTSSPWLEAPESEPLSAHSDCASSILDLYGCDSQSTTASSPKRSSSTSCYSNPHDPLKSTTGLFPSKFSNELYSDEQGGKVLSSNDSHPTPSNVISKQRNSTQNELLVLVQQLQNSTRYSEFDPARSSLNAGHDSSAASFIKNIVEGNPSVNSLKMINQNSQDGFVDDDDEAEVWKQILKG